MLHLFCKGGKVNEEANDVYGADYGRGRDFSHMETGEGFLDD